MFLPVWVCRPGTRLPGCGMFACRSALDGVCTTPSLEAGITPVPMFKVYVGNLDPRTTVDTLKPYFEPFGDAVDEIIVALDGEGQPRGFAIVLFRDPQRGQLAIETLTGKRINGREVQINEAVKKGKKTKPVEKGPRNSPLGPRAFQRPGGGRPGPGGARPGMGRPGGGMRPGGAGRPGFSASAGGGSAGPGARFNRNPRRLPGQGAGDPGAAPGGAAGSPGPTGPGAPRPTSFGSGSRMIGGGSRPIGQGGMPRPGSPRPPMPGGPGAGGTSRPLGGASRPLGSPPPARPAPPTGGAVPPKPPAPPAGDAAEAAPPRPRAVKKKPPAE